MKLPEIGVSVFFQPMRYFGFQYWFLVLGMLSLAGDDQYVTESLGMAGLDEILDDHDRFLPSLAVEVDMIIGPGKGRKGRIVLLPGFYFPPGRQFLSGFFVGDLVDLLEYLFHVPVVMTGFEEIDSGGRRGGFLPAHRGQLKIVTRCNGVVEGLFCNRIVAIVESGTGGIGFTQDPNFNTQPDVRIGDGKKFASR